MVTGKGHGYGPRRPQPLSGTPYRVEPHPAEHLGKKSIKTKRLLAATSDEFRAALQGLEVESDDEEEEN
ncbi:MAG: hypothetical protein J0L85_01380 [Zoogloea sp.]|nr:hypothetical protein [Zoogloea sp.]